MPGGREQAQVSPDNQNERRDLFKGALSGGGEVRHQREGGWLCHGRGARKDDERGLKRIQRLNGVRHFSYCSFLFIFSSM